MGSFFIFMAVLLELSKKTERRMSKMSRKENFKREIRRIRRKYFPTKKERQNRRDFMDRLMAANNLDSYIEMLKKG
jgi:hypothetical protein